MEILSYSISPGELLVTIQMQGMPKEAKTDNTTVRIQGQPQGRAAIYFQRQQIVFGANKTAGRGAISVTISLDDGDLAAESTEDYVPPAEEPEVQQPRVIRVSRGNVKQGSRLSLIGTNLQNVNSVAIQSHHDAYLVCTSVQATSKSVTFTLPEDFVGSGLIFISTPLSVGRRSTNCRVQVDRL